MGYLSFSQVYQFGFLCIALKAPGLYICGRNTPDPDSCMAKSIKSMDRYFREGIPELNVPSLDPMIIKEVVLADIPDFRAIATNAAMLGFANFSLSNAKFNAKNQTMSSFLRCKTIHLDTDFHVSAKIVVPINEKGRLKINTGRYLFGRFDKNYFILKF